MKRPSFQFYAGDWRANAKLRRCSHAERGIWLEVMCLMHDSEEYGVLRWPLEDIALAVGCKLAELQALVRKQVMKGAETEQAIEEFVYIPRHGGKDGDPVTLLPAQDGPIWFSSRMVRDEYIRQNRGNGSRFGDEPNNKPKVKPKPAIGSQPIPPIVDGSSASSSSSSSKDKSAAPPVNDEVKPEVRVVIWLRELGFIRMTPAHPDVHWMVKEAFTHQEFIEASRIARIDRGMGDKPLAFTYIKGILTDLRNPPDRKQTVEWWKTEQAINAKAAELGMRANVGEEYPQFVERIKRKIADVSRDTATAST